MQNKLQFWKLFGLLLLGLGTGQTVFAQDSGRNDRGGEDTIKNQDAESVGDVVIIGYGRSSRRNVVGSISTVNGKEITELPTQSFEGSLQGKAAGVQVTVGSGMAGSA